MYHATNIHIEKLVHVNSLSERLEKVKERDVGKKKEDKKEEKKKNDVGGKKKLVIPNYNDYDEAKIYNGNYKSDVTNKAGPSKPCDMMQPYLAGPTA